MSIVSDSHKFIYFSNGRCATGSIHGALRSLPKMKSFDPAKKNKSFWNKYNKHMPAKVMQKVIAPFKWNYFKFTFVRNPYDWVCSCYFFWVKMGRQPMPKNGLMDMQCFEEVVKYYSTEVGRRYDLTVPVRTQTSFIADIDGNLLTDFIAKFENINEDWVTICDKIGVMDPPILSVQNSSKNKKRPYTDHYDRTPGAKDLVDEYWGIDVKNFGYEFGV